MDTTSFKVLFKELYDNENKNDDKCSNELMIIYDFLELLQTQLILHYSTLLKYNPKYDLKLKNGGKKNKKTSRKNKSIRK